jgi:hypothetical protein
MTITIEIIDNHALNLLKELEKLKIIRLIKQGDKEIAVAVQKKEFKAIQLDTRGFKFNREEANER